jgi:hypothetical protein
MGRLRAPLGWTLPLALAACGYHPLYGGEQSLEPLAVVGTTSLVADAACVGEVEAGVRIGLARAGALQAGSGFPRVVVEVLRIDAASEGVRAASELGSSPGEKAPLARGTRIGIVARAWVERSAGAPHERDTGDVRTAELLSVEGDARLESLREADASRAASRRLGERLARRLLGQPEPPDEGM